MNTALLVQSVVGLVLIVAGLLQVAVIRAPDVPDDVEAKRSGRKLMCGALLLLGMYLMNMVYSGHVADRVMTLGLGLIGMSQAVFALIKLFPKEYGHE